MKEIIKMRITKNKKIFLGLIILFLFFVNCILGFNVLAQEGFGSASGHLKNLIETYLPQESGQTLGKASVPEIVGAVIYGVLGFLGIVCLILIIYAGLSWMTAEGNEEIVTRAKGIIKGAIIGVIVIALSYAVTYYVVSRIITHTESIELPAQPSGGPRGDYRGGVPPGREFCYCYTWANVPPEVSINCYNESTRDNECTGTDYHCFICP